MIRTEPLEPVTLPASVSPFVREAAQLLQMPDQLPARAMPTDELAEQLTEPLTGAAFLLGHRGTLADPLDLNLMADAVAEMVQRYFPALRMPEISLAIRRGVSGEWKRPTDIDLLNLPNITHWLRCYQTECRGVALLELKKERERLLRLPPPDPSSDFPERVTEWAARLAQRKPMDWARLDIGDIVYLWLQRIGAFRSYLTPRRQARILRTVGWQIASHRTLDKAERKELKEFRAQLRTGLLEGKHADRLRDACRKHLLREWLHMQAADTPISDLHLWLEDLAENASTR